MVTPLSGSSVAIGFLHTRRGGPTLTPPAQPPGRVVLPDRVDISAAGQQQTTEAAGEPTEAPAATPDAETALLPGAPQELETAARRALESLRQRDQEVRLHEQAHLLAAGPYAKGAPSYTYETGPDGKRYAVGGEVPIDLSAVPGNPQATLQKALTIRRAALAPTDPSATDQAVAAQATALAAQAQQELLEAQSLERLTTVRAAYAASSPTSEQSSATPLSSTARHVCGSYCQTYDTGPTPTANVPVAFTPLASAPRALQTYQLAAQTLAPQRVRW